MFLDVWGYLSWSFFYFFFILEKRKDNAKTLKWAVDLLDECTSYTFLEYIQIMNNERNKKETFVLDDIPPE